MTLHMKVGSRNRKTHNNYWLFKPWREIWYRIIYSY